MSFCKNCGRQLAEGANACTTCGCPVGMGMTHCSNCGEKFVPGSVFCVRCGSPATANPPQQPQPKPRKPRSRYAAAAFGIVMGSFGVHNFYLGHVGRGIGQIAVALAAYLLVNTFVLPQLAGVLLGGLWGFVEGVLILVGDINTDAYGKPLRQWKE